MQLVPGIEGLVRELVGAGKNIFLDYKYFDIGETVKEAVSRAADLGVAMLTVHGNATVTRAAAAAKGPRLKILAVTLLTSLDLEDMKEIYGVERDTADFVCARAESASRAGVDGVIASPREAAAIRRRVPADFLIVTPGVRPAGTGLDDHKRSGTPTDAIADGADYLVVGRPITRASDPADVARRVVAEMQQAFDRR